MTEKNSLETVQPDKLPTYFQLSNASLRTRRLLGCIHCEWKSNDLCPHGCRSGPGNKANIETGICQQRLDFFAMFLPPDKENPSFEEWRRYYNTWQGQLELNSIFAKMKKMERQIEIFKQDLKTRSSKYVSDGSENDYQFESMLNEYNEVADRWTRLWGEVRKRDVQETEIEERRKPRVISIEEKRELTIHQFNKVLRDPEKFIEEAEFKEDEK